MVLNHISTALQQVDKLTKAAPLIKRYNNMFFVLLVFVA